MLAVYGYYDGSAIRLLEQMPAKPNQRVIVTLMDEFVEPEQSAEKKSIRGALASYADPALAEKEQGAWERAMVEKYGNL